MEENKRLSQEPTTASRKLAELEAQLTQLQSRLSQAENEIARADAYRQIQNVWAAHAYCYRAQQQRYELEHFWAKEHDDIMYAHGDMGFVGRKEVTDYYAAGNEIMNQGKLELACQLFPGEIENIPENLGVGDLVVRLQATPYIEIAADGQTAKGIWYVLGYNVEMDRQGEADVVLLLCKEVVDFVKEKDGWKIWHFRDVGDFMGQVNDTFLKTILKRSPPPSGGGRTVDGAFPEPNRRLQKMPEEDHYSVLRPARFSPELPKPYTHWSDEMSLAKPAE